MNLNYWDNSGGGGGFDNLSFDSFKLSYSLIQNIKDGFNDGAEINDGSDRAITTHDLRLYDIDTNPDGKLTIGLAAVQSSDSAGGNGTDGWQLHLQHQQKPLRGGFNRLALQYGSGAGATLSKNPDDKANSNDRSWRIVEQLTIQPSANWAGQTTLVYEDREDKQRWLPFGVRPIYYFSDHLNLALELGHDRVTPQGGETMQLTKLTLAPQLSAARGFFSRPVLRAFVTYANWNAAARDYFDPDRKITAVAGGTSGVYALEMEGLSYALQVEAWW